MSSTQADQSFEQTVKGLCAMHDRVRVDALHHFGGGVEEAPRVAGTEVIVRRGAPFLQDAGDLAGRDRSAVRGLDDEIVGLRIGDPAVLVTGDALVDLQESLAETTDGSRGEMPEIALGELGVLATDPDLATEGEIVADEDPRTGDEAGWVSLVVRVADPDDPAVVAILPSGEVDLEQTEHSSAFMGEGKMLTVEPEARRLQLRLDFVDETGVGQRIPGFRPRWSGNIVDRPPVD